MEAGWHPDPSGRHRRRYHDGSRWTAHVEDNGEVSQDPDGRAALASAAQLPAPTPNPVMRGWRANVPDGAGADRPSPGDPQALTEFFGRLGPEARERPVVRLSTVLAGFGGAFVAFSVLTLFAETLTSGGPVLAIGLGVVGVALWVRLAVATHIDYVRHAATGVAIVGIVTMGAGVALIVDDSGGSGTSQVFALVAALLFLVGWAAPGFRERPSFFGLGVASATNFTASLFAGDGVDGYSGADEQWFDVYLGDFGEFVTRTGAVYLVLGLLLLALVMLADRKGFRGLGTGLAYSAVTSATVGALMLLPEFDNAGGAILVAGVGAAMGAVGALGDRRVTTWLGGSMVALGAVSALAIAIEPNSTGSTATVGFLCGALLIVSVPLARYLRAAQADRPDSTT